MIGRFIAWKLTLITKYVYWLFPGISSSLPINEYTQLFSSNSSLSEPLKIKIGLFIAINLTTFEVPEVSVQYVTEAYKYQWVLVQYVTEAYKYQ